MPSSTAEKQTTALTVIEAAVREDAPRITEILPTHIPVARVIETVMAAARRTPALLECTPASFVWAMREAARWGLLPDGVMGSGYLVPRRNGKTGEMEATFVAGYRGLEDLARRSGIVGSIVSGWHCENDPVFEVRMGLHGDVAHVPATGPRGAIVGFYAAAWLTNGAPPVVAYMPEGEVIAIRDAVPGWERGPWRSHFAQMGRKTAVRRLVGQLPLNADIQDIIGAEDEGFAAAINVTPAVPVETPPDVAQARSLLAERHGVASEPTPESNGAGGPSGDVAAAPESDVIEGKVHFVDRPGLDGKEVEAPDGPVIGLRVDVLPGTPAAAEDPDPDWYQVVLSGAIREAYLAGESRLSDGCIVRVTGRRVIVPRATPEGVAMPPVIRIIATEVPEWPID